MNSYDRARRGRERLRDRQMNGGMMYAMRQARDRAGRGPYRPTTNARDLARNISTYASREISEGAPPSSRIALK